MFFISVSVILDGERAAPEDTEDENSQVKAEEKTLKPTAQAKAAPVRITATFSLTADEVLALSDWFDENAYLSPSCDTEIYDISVRLSSFLKEHGIVS